MAAWLYQMAEDEQWTPEDYRIEVWEGEPVTWPHRKIVSREALKPTSGDPIILFFAKSGTQAPGICGWGVILRLYAKKEEIRFRAVFPTDLLKMNPIWDNEVEDLINEVRRPHPRATMWAMTADAYNSSCRRIRGYVGTARA